MQDVWTKDAGKVIGFTTPTRFVPLLPIVRWVEGGFDMEAGYGRLVYYEGDLKKLKPLCITHGRDCGTKHNKGGGMTFTLRKMSGKGIRMLARYLAVLKLGGELNDTPESFYESYISSTRQSRRECEAGFAKCTDHYEERLRDEDGYMSSEEVQRVAAFVGKKLGDGMWIEGEVAADHHRNGVDPSPKRAVKSSVPVTGNVASLLKQLKAAVDPEAKRKLRRQLRKLGHRGGSQT